MCESVSLTHWYFLIEGDSFMTTKLTIFVCVRVWKMIKIQTLSISSLWVQHKSNEYTLCPVEYAPNVNFRGASCFTQQLSIFMPPQKFGGPCWSMMQNYLQPFMTQSFGLSPLVHPPKEKAYNMYNCLILLIILLKLYLQASISMSLSP